VVDFAQHFAGPGTAMYLADQGAEVIKVEPPNGGRDRMGGGFSESFLVLNRGKRSIALDIRPRAGREVACKLVERADVLMVAWPPGQAERLGYGYEAMHELNPRLVYASLTGWGNSGPMADTLGYDRLVQAHTGIMAANRQPDGMPTPAPIFIADMCLPMLLSYGITLALLARERTGQGQKVETSQLDAEIAMQAIYLVYPGGRDDPLEKAGHAGSRSPTYRTQDDRYLTLAPITNEHWLALWRLLDLASVVTDADVVSARGREPAMAAIDRLTVERFAAAPLQEWQRRLDGAGVPYALVLTRDEFVRQPQAWANDMLTEQDHPVAGRMRMMGVPVRLSETTGAVSAPAPAFGQHTREILGELGYAQTAVDELFRTKIVI
jgi:CoA:oxalate CoA-transferase